MGRAGLSCTAINQGEGQLSDQEAIGGIPNPHKAALGRGCVETPLNAGSLAVVVDDGFT